VAFVLTQVTSVSYGDGVHPIVFVESLKTARSNTTASYLETAECVHPLRPSSDHQYNILE